MSGRNGTAVPTADDAERSLIGAAILATAARDVLARMVRPDQFATPTHAAIAAALIDAHAAGRQVDAVTLHAELGRYGAGDVSLSDLLELQGNTPATSNAPRYAELVLDAAEGRRLLALADDLRNAAHARPAERHALTSRVAGDLATIETAAAPELELEDVAVALTVREADETTILVRSDGARLLYPGAVHAFIAEPSFGKTTVACMAVLQVLDAGAAVLYLDFEDTLPRLLRRLLALGAHRDDLVARFRYARPGPLTDTGRAQLARLADAIRPDLVVIDGVAESMAAQGLDEDSAGDVGRWWSVLPRPLASTGAAVVLLDHTTKAKEGRGRWARGSGAKLAAIDGAAYTLEASPPFSRTTAGMVKITVAKDRPGAVGAIGDTAAIVHVEPLDNGARIIWRIEPSLFADDDTTGERRGPVVTTELLDTVVDVLDDLADDGGISRRTVADHVRGRGVTFGDHALGAALARLEQTGRIGRRIGSRGAHLYHLPARQQTLTEAAQ